VQSHGVLGGGAGPGMGVRASLLCPPRAVPACDKGALQDHARHSAGINACVTSLTAAQSRSPCALLAARPAPRACNPHGFGKECAASLPPPLLTAPPIAALLVLYRLGEARRLPPSTFKRATNRCCSPCPPQVAHPCPLHRPPWLVRQHAALPPPPLRPGRARWGQRSSPGARQRGNASSSRGTSSRSSCSLPIHPPTQHPP